MGYYVVGEWVEYRIRELCGVAKGEDESVLRWFGHMEKMENDRITKKGVCGRVWG